MLTLITHHDGLSNANKSQNHPARDGFVFMLTLFSSGSRSVFRLQLRMKQDFAR